MSCQASMGYSALLLLPVQGCKSVVGTDPRALLTLGTMSDPLRGTNGCSAAVGLTQIILNQPEKSQARSSHETVSPGRFCSLGKAEFQAVFLPRGTAEHAVQHWLLSAQGQLGPSWAMGFHWASWEPELARAKAPWLHSQVCPLKSHLSGNIPTQVIPHRLQSPGGL